MNSAVSVRTMLRIWTLSPIVQNLDRVFELFLWKESGIVGFGLIDGDADKWVLVGKSWGGHGIW